MKQEYIKRHPYPKEASSDIERLILEDKASKQRRYQIQTERRRRQKIARRIDKKAPLALAKLMLDTGKVFKNQKDLFRNASTMYSSVKIPASVRKYFARNDVLIEVKDKPIPAKTMRMVQPIIVDKKKINDNRRMRNEEDRINADVEAAALMGQVYDPNEIKVVGLPEDFEFLSILYHIWNMNKIFENVLNSHIFIVLMCYLMVAFLSILEEYLKHCSFSFALVVVMVEAYSLAMKRQSYLYVTRHAFKHGFLYMMPTLPACALHLLHNLIVLYLASEEIKAEAGGGAFSNDFWQSFKHTLTEPLLIPHHLMQMRKRPDKLDYWGLLADAFNFDYASKKVIVGYVNCEEEITSFKHEYCDTEDEEKARGIDLSFYDTAKLFWLGGIITTIQLVKHSVIVDEDMRGKAQRMIDKECTKTMLIPCAVVRAIYKPKYGWIKPEIKSWSSFLNMQMLSFNTTTAILNGTFDQRMDRALMDYNTPKINASVIDQSRYLTAAFQAALTTFQTQSERLNELRQVSTISLLLQLIQHWIQLEDHVNPCGLWEEATFTAPHYIQSEDFGALPQCTMADVQQDTGLPQKTSVRSTMQHVIDLEENSRRRKRAQANADEFSDQTLLSIPLPSSKNTSQELNNNNQYQTGLSHWNATRMTRTNSNSSQGTDIMEKMQMSEKHLEKQKDMESPNTSDSSIPSQNNSNLFLVPSLLQLMKQRSVSHTSLSILQWMSVVLSLMSFVATCVWLKVISLLWSLITGEFLQGLDLSGLSMSHKISDYLGTWYMLFTIAFAALTLSALVTLWHQLTKPSCQVHRGRARRMEF